MIKKSHSPETARNESTTNPMNMMKIKQYTTAAFFILSMITSSADPEADGALFGDLNGDGKKETVSWHQFVEKEELGTFYQLRVTDDDGQLLWSGPKVMDAENPMVFGDFEFGSSFPDLVADIDGDGAVELIAPEPQGDVSPTWFIVLRWKGGRFVPVRSAPLLESPRGSGLFPWSKEEPAQGTWISRFKKANPDGTFLVDIFQYMAEATPRSGEAIVSITPKGYRVKKWVAPLKALTDMPSPEPEGLIVRPERAGGVVVYRARLSSRDHFNSSGKRLKNVEGILRQDRANYHKGKGDEDDGPDPLFRTASGRNGMDARRAVAVGAKSATWEKAIIEGTPLVEVEVTDKELKVKILKP